MELLLTLIVILVSILIVLIAGLAVLTWISEHGRYQKPFISGKLPAHAPDGFHPGSAHVLFDMQTPWLGKSFVASEQKGFNIFTPTGAAILAIATPFYTLFSKNHEGNTHAYYFNTSKTKGVRDPEVDVIRLDYSDPQNPWIIRIIVDEIVEIKPHQYLGKIHIRLPFGLFATVGYFGLKKHS